MQILDYFDLENQLQIRLKEKDKESEDFIDILFEKNTFTLKNGLYLKANLIKLRFYLRMLRLNDKINKKILR